MKTALYLLSLLFFFTPYFNSSKENTHYTNYKNQTDCEEFLYLLPPVGVQKTNLSGEASNDGIIHFDFDDELDYDSIEFSIDGGLTFPYIVGDNQGTYTIENLTAGSYHVKSRWAGKECILEMGTLQLIPDPCGSYQIVDSIPNILFIVADDFGLEAAPFSDLASEKANMPVLERLVSEGLVFDNAWSTPFCAPTRAGIITGKHGFRTGVLNIPTHNTLNLNETTIQKHIDTEFPDKYEQAIIGKWHLNNEILDYDYPAQMGIPHFDGLRRGASGSYYKWKRQTNGVVQNSEQYITTALTDASLQWIEDQGEKPWHLWLTHIAPHKPFHKPPNHLHTRDSLPNTSDDILANPVPYYIAMLESLDKEVGRLLDNMCPNVKNNTVIIFISDNGTPNEALQAPYIPGRGKGTFFQGGIKVPMIVSGKGVTRIGERDNTFVNTTDLFATFAGIAGSDSTQINDSKNLVPLFSQTDTVRQCNYSDFINGWTITIGDYKLMYKFDGGHFLFNLDEDPFEHNNLYFTSDSFLLNIIDELYYKGLEIRGELCLDNIIPDISVSQSDETVQGLDDGSIHFSFIDEPTRQGIEFSIDGVAYPYSTSDTVGNYSITDLEPRTYPVFARWQEDDCPVFLDSIHIMSACATAHPFSTVTIVDEGNVDFNDGKITFDFADDTTKHRIEFSLDGGKTYPYNISDHIERHTILNLAPKTYQIWERWGADDCPNFLGTYTINEYQACEELDYPNVILSTTDISSPGAFDGMIHFDFEDHPDRDKINFHISGDSIYSISDSLNHFTVNNLSVGSYKIIAKWGNLECPIYLGKVEINEPCNSLIPIVKINKTDQSDPALNDGSIQFSIVDISSKGKIEFSINGCLSFPVEVDVNSGVYIWDGLSPGKYDVWARWGNASCPIFLESLVIGNACPNNSPAKAAVLAIDESLAGSNDGSIQFTAIDNPNQLHVEFSIDGGITFPHKMTDTNAPLIINNLKPGNYNTWIRWAHKDYCYTYLETVTVGSPSCNDGIQNGEETGIDCGETSCIDCNIACSYQKLYEEDFENGFGMWKNGGLDCRRSILDSLYATSGNYCVRIRDNSFYSKLTSINLDLSTYDNVRLDFNFMTRSMDNETENFYLQMSLDGGSTYSLVKNWDKGDEFENNIRYTESIEIAGPFTDQTVFRFKCDASGYNDWVYLDDIEVYGCQFPSVRQYSENTNVDLESIVAFPNPTKDKLQVEIKSLHNSKAGFEIITLSGKSIFKDVWNLEKGTNTREINTSNYPTGIYILTIKTKNTSRTLKIVKLKT